MSARAEHLLNAFEPILVMLSGRMTSVKLLQDMKMPGVRTVTPSGMTIFVKLLQR